MTTTVAPTTTTAAPVAASAGWSLDTGDVAFMLGSTALVFIMTPGLGLFYAGMVKRKNTVATMMQSMAAGFIVLIQWWFWGYSLALSNGNAFIGDMSYFLMKDLNLINNPHANAPTIPNILFMMFQGMFAIITPALITGGVAERLRFRTYCIFLLLWSTLVYCPVTHWIWAPTGFLFKLGALDLAGGTAVHITAGFSTLTFLLFLRRRKNYQTVLSKLVFKMKQKRGSYTVPPVTTHFAPVAHNIPLVVIGTGLLWFGWQGFNGGSTLKSGLWAAAVFASTNFSAAAAAIGWMLMDWINIGKPSLVGACNGVVVGLVAITPAAGFIQIPVSILCGFSVAVIVYWLVKIKLKFMDDSLDAFAIHGLGGVYGCLFTGVFASAEFVQIAAGATIPGGWWDKNWMQVPIQLAAVAVTVGWSMVVTAIILAVFWKIPKLGWDVTPEEEEIGLDQSEHGEIAYTFIREEEEEAGPHPDNFGWIKRLRNKNVANAVNSPVKIPPQAYAYSPSGEQNLLYSPAKSHEFLSPKLENYNLNTVIESSVEIERRFSLVSSSELQDPNSTKRRPSAAPLSGSPKSSRSHSPRSPRTGIGSMFEFHRIGIGATVMSTEKYIPPKSRVDNLEKLYNEMKEKQSK